MLGAIKYGRQNPLPTKDMLMRFWTAAAPQLAHHAFFIDDNARPTIAAGFGSVVERLGIKVPACAIMNDHVHVLTLHCQYRIEYIVNQLKGAATRAMKFKQTPWTRGCWKVFIDDNETLVGAVNYIRANSIYAGLPAQSWDFVTPLSV